MGLMPDGVYRQNTLEKDVIYEYIYINLPREAFSAVIPRHDGKESGTAQIPSHSAVTQGGGVPPTPSRNQRHCLAQHFCTGSGGAWAFSQEIQKILFKNFLASKAIFPPGFQNIWITNTKSGRIIS